MSFTQNGPAINAAQADLARRKLLSFIEQLPLQYHKYDAGHELNMAMASDFKQWLAGQLDRSDAPHI